MYSRVRVVQDRVILEPGSCGQREADEGHMDAEIFSSAHCDVPYSAQVHAWLVGLLLYQDTSTWSAWLTVANVVHSNHSELVLFSFFQPSNLHQN